MKQTSARKTMLLSILMSAPGPLLVGIGLLSGRSNTQLADFIRRTAEFLALIMAYLTYRSTESTPNPRIRRKLERRSNTFVGIMMCVGGTIMLGLAWLGQKQKTGTVIPGLIIALLGGIANSLFWRKYASLHRTAPDAILAVQSRLYRAKALVDGCVVLALCSMLFWPESTLSQYLDTIGSTVVAVYLVWCGIRTIREAHAHSSTTSPHPVRRTYEKRL